MTKSSTPDKNQDPKELAQQADAVVKTMEDSFHEMSLDDKLALVNLQKFLSAIPTEKRSQFLAVIGSNEFFRLLLLIHVTWMVVL
jgi:hypothetical protein